MITKIPKHLNTREVRKLKEFALDCLNELDKLNKKALSDLEKNLVNEN